MSQPLPVTILAGAGRADGAHALKSLLEGNQDLRLTAIVPKRNHKRLRSKGPATVLPTTERLVQLGQGCSCCTVRGDLMSKIRRVAHEGSADHVLVHASSHADLKVLAKTFTVADATGAILSDNAHIESLVAVVGAAELLTTLHTEGVRSLIERIELADVIIVHDAEKVDADVRRRAEGAIKALNPAAHILSDTRRGIDLADVSAEEPFDLRAAEMRASRLGTPDTDFGTSGWLSQFTYFERVPFHPGRLHAFLQEPWPNVIRVQGSLWVASSPDTSIEVNIAGGSKQTRPAGTWWVAIPPDQRPTSPGFQQYLESLWDPTYGDRHQALTIVGMDLDRDALERRLKSCLLTEQEVAEPSTWASMPHPFSWPKS